MKTAEKRKMTQQELNEAAARFASAEKDNIAVSGSAEKACLELQKTFQTMEDLAVRTAEDLKKHHRLYDEFGLRLYNFVDRKAIHTRMSKKKNGGCTVGNHAKVKYLNSRGIWPEEVVNGICIHVLERLDKVLAAPLAARCFYIQTMSNHYIVDLLRSLPPEEEIPQSLDVPIDKEDANGVTKLEMLRYHPTPTARQIWREEQKGRRALYKVVQIMSDRPGMLLAFLGRNLLNYDNEMLYRMFQQEGVHKASMKILQEAGKQFDMNYSVLLPLFPAKKFTAQDFGMAEDLSGDLARQITRLASRGRDYLQHHNPMA